MSWVSVGIAGASAIMGARQAREQQKAQKAQNMAEATKTEFSPWTGMGAGQIKTGGPSAEMGALQGALGGAMMGQQFGGLGAAKPTTDAGQGMSAFGSPEEAMLNSGANMLDPKIKKPSLYGGGMGSGTSLA